MAPHVPPDPGSGLAVLLVGGGFVEWFEPTPGGAARHARVSAAEAGPRELARAVTEARRAAQASTRSCVLALAPPFVAHRLVSLPRLGRRDLQEVFLRRARALAGGSEEAYFTARDMSTGGARRGDAGASGQRSWLLASVRVDVRDLRLLLRDQGLRVRRVVSAELAALKGAAQRVERPGLAAIVILVGETAVSVALVEGGRLCYQESIEGDLGTRPGLVTGLVHEVKTCAAFWRKESRGKTVTEVVVAGLAKARTELLAVTLASVLPGASVRSTAEEDDPDGRLGLLRAALGSGPLDLDLKFWLPQRRRFAGLFGGLLATAAAAAMLFSSESGSERARALRDEARELRRGTADLEELGELERAHEGLLEEIESRIRRGDELAARGVPLERALATVLSALDGQAELDQLSLRAAAGAVKLTLVGSCASHPSLLVRRLRTVLDRLERAGARGAELSLPEELGRGAPESSTTFAIEARLGA